MKAALYLRSSKDRSDVSIDAQRRELLALAKVKHLQIIAEYSDVVESGKDDNRPGFRALYNNLKSGQFQHVLILDTSRLSRRRHISLIFEMECEKYGVSIIYKSLPDVDPINTMLLKSVLQSIDEWHSLISKQKGLMGMEENIRKGYRAGGRAPRGYKLKHIETGTVREGEPVTKSTLEPGEEAPIVKRYLEGRAKGRSRAAILEELGVKWPSSSMVDLEWNALTYAGHTIWNVHNERKSGEGYKGKPKRKPREEWIIQENTHPALITGQQAEMIIAMLEAQQKPRRTKQNYLLTGILETPNGLRWRSNGDGWYRVKLENGTKKVKRDEIEPLVIERIFSDMKSPKIIKKLTEAVRKHVDQNAHDPAKETREQLKGTTKRIAKMLDLVADMSDPAPLLRKVEELEKLRKSLESEISRLDQEYQQAQALKDLTEADVKRILGGFISEAQEADRSDLKDLIRSVVDRIELSPELECRIHYRVGMRGNKMASPRECELIPPLFVSFAA